MSENAADQKVVLIVDDDKTNRLVLRALIKESGFAYIEADNGEQAVQAVEDHHIDIVLLDVMMPVMDGYQTAKLIKSQQKRFIPIIFLTAITEEAALAKCIEAGGDDFLTKPYNHVLLTAKINSMLRIAGLYKKIDDKNQIISESNLQMQQEMNVTKKLFDRINKHDMRGSESGLRYSMSPMSMFNGDVIVAQKNQTDGLDVLVGDFTGHGLGAAIGSIPITDVFYSMVQKGFSMSDILAEANKKLIDLLPTQMFMASAAISIDRSNNVLSVLNCGLPDLYLHRNGQIIRTFKSKNIPLGISQFVPSQLEIEMESLEYGDRLIAATDGIMEATNANGDMFGLERLLKVFDHDGEQLFDSILSSCSHFCSGADQTDDITLLELCHQKEVNYPAHTVTTGKSPKASDWAMQFSLDIKSLRQFDVLPYVMQGMGQLQPLDSGRTSVQTVLTELFANALDHGILKLDSSMKDTPQGYMEFYQEKQKRLEDMDDGNMQITLRHEVNGKGGRLSIYIIDSGDGFDYKSQELTEKNAYSGRGLKLISSLCSDIKILGKGNSIIAYYDWEQAS